MVAGTIGIIGAIIIGAILAITVWGVQLIYTIIGILVIVAIGLAMNKVGEYIKARPVLSKNIDLTVRITYGSIIAFFIVSLITILITKALGN